MLQEKILPPDGWQFGESVAISDNYLAIGTVGGSMLNTDGQGSAYIYFNNGSDWTRQAKLQASDGSDIDGFGNALSLLGTVLIAGEDKAQNNDSISTGAAYIFKLEDTSWVEEQKLTASDGSYGDLFGSSVSISRDYAIISAIKDQDKGINSGSAYIFMNDSMNWIEKQKILASDGETNDNFGISVSISGNNVIVGANGNNDNGNNSGSAYIYSDFVTDVRNEQSKNPLSFNLRQNYPNPFNPSTTIKYELKAKSHIKLSIYDVTGREIKTLVNKNEIAGYHSISFNASDLASGIYIYKLKSGSFEKCCKMILLH